MSAVFLGLGIDRFLGACRHVHELPYGYNSDKDDPMTLFAERKGTCTTKHAVIGLLVNYGVFGFRDLEGIRLRVVGVREAGAGPEYMIASESVALDVLGFKLLDDVAPGEAIFIDQHGPLPLGRPQPLGQIFVVQGGERENRLFIERRAFAADPLARRGTPRRIPGRAGRA